VSGNLDLKALLARQKAWEAAKACLESVEMEDGSRVCRGEFGYFSVPKEWSCDRRPD
jgi:hypothetical protein